MGGLNNQTRGVEASLPFEDNIFAMTSLGGSNNYNFRPSAMPAGHRLSVAGANRNYIFRGMYNYSSGYNAKGWAWSMGLTYRYAGEGYVEGTFYNALSYYLGVEKRRGCRYCRHRLGDSGCRQRCWPSRLESRCGS